MTEIKWIGPTFQERKGVGLILGSTTDLFFFIKFQWGHLIHLCKSMKINGLHKNYIFGLKET